MRHLLLIFCFFVSWSGLNAQDSSQLKFPDWQGKISIGEVKLKMIFHFKEGNCYIDVPLQGLKNFKADKTQFRNDSVFVAFNMMQALYKGKVAGQKIDGKWIQMGKTFPLIMGPLKELKRPQMPKAPFAYNVKEVTYTNPDKSITFGATLTTPKGEGKFPAVIMITGSGQQDRDETVFGHKPFWVIADHLTEQGIAVLRVDDRGIGKTTGKETLATATSSDFAKDVIAGLEFLKQQPTIDAKNIGLIGHSEGGMIAAIVAKQRKDIAFVVSMAGPGIKGKEILIKQFRKNYSQVLPAASVDSMIVFDSRLLDVAMNYDKIVAETIFAQELIGWVYNQDENIQKMFGVTMQNGMKTVNSRQALMRYKVYTLPWYKYFLKFQPDEYLSQLQIPWLALNGEKDIQVLCDENLQGISKSFSKAGNQKFEMKKYPDMNHFFQHCETGMTTEVEDIEETVAPEVLNDISDWIKKQVK
ncbi:alpha/beta fold hydrolase [Prolixibacteraceae bacterium JC049]|nr:alpha/beta fold hydrolase [Prolixibacteraceae bacterium JC049]